MAHRSFILIALILASCAPRIAREPLAPIPEARPQVETPPAEAQATPNTPPVTNEPYLSPLPTPVPRPGDSPQETQAALRFFEALQLLEEARKLDPERNEAIFNEAVLLQEYGRMLDGPNYESGLLRAKQLYQWFLRRAEGQPDQAEAFRAAQLRLSDINDATTCVFRESEAERKARLAEEKQRAAEEEALMNPD